MRLWHESLIPKLPRQQLLGQHRECAALRGAGWGRPHATVNYVFSHPPYKLYQYHVLIMQEMMRRGYRPDRLWFDACYRGRHLPPYPQQQPLSAAQPLYSEHDDAYLQECLDNLRGKNIVIHL